jgi:hypothetical protein
VHVFRVVLCCVVQHMWFSVSVIVMACFDVVIGHWS